LILAAIVVVAVPVAAALGVVDRFGGKDDYSSNDAHRDSFGSGYDILLSEPLGRGLATSAGAGQRADVAGATITETQFLQIGTQLGILGLVLWLLVAFHVLLALGKADRQAPPRADHDLLAGARTALLGLLAAGLFLQIFIEFSLSWATWMLAGLALGSIEGERHDAVPTRHASHR
jgi:O-antigen ligase